MQCTKCEHVVNLEVEISFKFFICPKCFSLHEFLIDKLYFKREILKTSFDSSLVIGKSIVFDNENYCISNVVYKTINSDECWTEYELIALSGNKKYVIEENGHWIISEQIEVKKDSDSLEIHHNNIDYRIFERGSFHDESWYGFFDYEPTKKVIGFRDYINPPNVLSVEVEEKNPIYYLGKSYSEKEIKNIFNPEFLPVKEGIGIAQPFFINLYNTIIIFCCASIVVLFFHMIFYQKAKNQLIYKQTIDLVTQIDKEIETDIFELKGPIAPLNIIIQTDVDNSWLATDFSLENQSTGESAFFSKDIELYSGYEGGESWTEGSQTEDFTICGVSSGKYKIVFKPTKDTSDMRNTVLFVEVYWDKSNNWNFMSVILSFLFIVIILYYLNNNFETRRWYDSDYSPYNKDE